MNTFYAFYDGHCGLCALCCRWIDSQPKHVPVMFLPYQSPEARVLCPQLETLDPGREIVVMADTGEIYQGDGAWIALLWATKDWRSMANRLSRPALRPVARQIVQAVSQNRLCLSRLLQRLPRCLTAP